MTIQECPLNEKQFGSKLGAFLLSGGLGLGLK